MGSFMKCKFMCYVDILLILALIILGCLSHSLFEIAYGGLAALFWLVPLRLSFLSGKDESTQKKLCNTVGVFLLLPSLGIIAIGIFIPFGAYFSLSMRWNISSLSFRVCCP